MAYFQDLTQTDCFGAHPLPRVAVGWLKPPHPIPQGIVDAPTRARLDAHIAYGFEFVSFRGFHSCLFCPQTIGHRGRPLIVSGIGNCLIPGAREVYSCPELIVHYIDVHGYEPPTAFLAAVRSAPMPGSSAYFERLLFCGGDAVEDRLARLSVYSEGDIKGILQSAIIAWRQSGRPRFAPSQ